MELSRKREGGDPVFSVIIPLRNRWGPRLRNCVKSIVNQTLQPLEIIVADYGSTEEGHEEIMRTLDDFDCSIYYYPTDEVWNLSKARNMGIRRSNAQCENVAVIDADLILEPRVIETLSQAHASRPHSYISCFIRMLTPGSWLDEFNDTPEDLCLPDDFLKLKNMKFWSSAGWGGLVSAPRSWLFRVRGFDERMRFWGAEDGDLWKRAGLDGMDCYRINDLKRGGTEIYHQFHDDCLSWDQRRLTKAEADQIEWNKMMAARDNTIVRNNERWGLWESSKLDEDRYIYD